MSSRALLLAVLFVAGATLLTLTKLAPGPRAIAAPAATAPEVGTDRLVDCALPVMPTAAREETPFESGADLIVEVLGYLDRPVPQADVLLHRGEEVLARGATNDRGLARFEPTGGDARIFVWDGLAPYDAALSFVPGRQTIRLPRPRRLRIEIDEIGRLHSWPLDLRLEHHPHPGGSKGLATKLRQAARPMLPRQEQHEGQLDGQGAWTVDGLPTDWAGGTLVAQGGAFLPDSFAVRAQETTGIPSTAESVHLRLAYYLRIVGRVLNPDHTPASRAVVHLVQFGRRSNHTSVQEGGHFSIRFSPRDGWPEAIQANTFQETGSVEMRLDPPERTEMDWDAGTIVLAPTHRYELYVHDPEGSPIPRAEIIPPERPSVQRTRANAFTDASGRAVVELDPGTRSLVVGAPMFKAKAIDLPAEDARLDVELAHGNQLTLEVSGNGGRIPEGSLFRIESTGPLFEPCDSWLPCSGTIPAGHEFACRVRDGAVFLTPWGTHPPSFGGLVAGRVFRMRLFFPGEQDVILWESGRVQLESREERILVVVLDAASYKLVGRLLDHRGNAVRHAEVGIGRLDSGGLRTVRTWGDSFAFQGPLERCMHLEVFAESCAPYIAPNFEIPLAGEPVVIRLPTPSRVSVHAVHADGRQAPVEYLTWRPEGSRWSLFHLRERCIEHAPPGKIELNAHLAGRRIGIVHDVSQGDASILVPDPGSAHFRITVPTRTLANQSARVRMRDLSAPEVSLERSFQLDAFARAWVEFPHVFAGDYDAVVCLGDGADRKAVVYVGRACTLHVEAGARVAASIDF
jgi:hypothetical protein